MLIRIRKAQSTLEYAVVIAVVVGALTVMNLYMKKGVQGKLKDSADRVGEQFIPESYSKTWKTETQDSSDRAKWTTTREERTDKITGTITSKTTVGEVVVSGETESWGTKPANREYSNENIAKEKITGATYAK